jgi:ribosomal protein S18 acetylase RimI-like enzyme
MYAIRSATLEDLTIVVSWIRTADECERWAGTQVAFPIVLSTLPSTIRFAERSAYLMVLGGSVMAFGQVLDKPQNRQHSATFIVCPLHRGRGHGRTFLQELLYRATADRVSLNVNEDNSVAISLYAAAGFTAAERPQEQQASPRSRYMEWKRSRTG